MAANEGETVCSMYSERNINLAYLKFKQGSEATTKSKYHTCKHNISDLKKQNINSTFLITQQEERLLIILVYTRLAINPFYRVVLVNKCIHAFPSFWPVLCTPAGTPHSHHRQIVLAMVAMASCGNSSLSIQPFMPSNIISSITLPLMFKSVAKHLFLVVRLMCQLTTTFSPLISSPNCISST